MRRATTLLLMTGLLAAPAAAWAQNCTADARGVVTAIYRQVLQRAPNGDEANTWVNQLSSGQSTVRELVQNVASSAENRQRFLSPANDPQRRAAVTTLYRQLLGREPDAGGLQAHAETAVRSGIDTVVSSLISSSEYQQKFGEQAVPGQGVRYCGAAYNSSANNNRFRFRGMDANNNGMIERSEWNGSTQSFNVHDWNRDGVLSNAEVRTGAQRWPNDEGDFDPNGAATWTPRAFRQIDRNRDGRIVPNEWYYGAESFRRADRDRNGALNQVEFENNGDTNTQWDDDRDDRFEYLDMNNNGRIEAREWHGSTQAFQWLDRNNDNVLSRQEVVGDGSTRFDSFASIDTNGNGRLELGEWEWSAVSFRRYDTNKDGIISRQEFTAAGGAPSTSR
jgi:Ca2+-binding EF-hand superfamily protein